MILQLKSEPKFSLFNLQVSGKAPKLVSTDNKIILKCFIDTQSDFYNYMFGQIHVSHPHYSLKQYLPMYLGQINLQAKPQIEFHSDQNKDINVWLEHVKNRYQKKNQNNRFILMENFLSLYKRPNIFDIKIGGRPQKPNKITNSVSQFKIKLNGMVKTSQNNQKQFISKYITNQVQYKDQILKYLAYFFTCSNKLNLVQIQKTVDKLKDLALQIRSMRGWKFVSTSICIIYDSQNLQRVDIKYIDFGRATLFQNIQSYDEDTSFGLQNLIKFMSQILQNNEKYQNVQIEKEGQIVPDSKIKKFGSNQVNQNKKKIELEDQ